MNKILVSGCAGFIGSNLTEELLKQDYFVIGLDNLLRGTLSNMASFKNDLNFRFIEGDIRAGVGLDYILKDVDTIFHLAALARIQPSIQDPIEYHDNNLNGTLNLLSNAVKAKVRRFVFSSSSSVYGIQDKMPEKETATPNPLNPYAAQKLMCEYYMKVFANCYKLETISLRYFNVFGLRQPIEGTYATVIGIFLNQIKNMEPMTIIGDGEQRRDFTFVSDVVEANIKAILSDKVGKGEVINIGTGKNYSINEVANLITGQRINVPERQFEVKETLADISKAKELLDWQPKVDLEKGIKILKGES